MLNLLILEESKRRFQINRRFGEDLNLYSSIQEIIVTDQEQVDGVNLLHCFTGLIKNCRNTKKMVINSSNRHLDNILNEVLPFMKHLKEIQLTIELTEERIQFIRKNCPKIEIIETTFKENIYLPPKIADFYDTNDLSN